MQAGQIDLVEAEGQVNNDETAQEIKPGEA